MNQMPYEGLGSFGAAPAGGQDSIETVRPPRLVALNQHDDGGLPLQRESYPDDAPSSVVASDVHRALREEAIRNDTGPTALVPLALLWEALAQGVCRVVDTFFTNSRCYVVTAGVARTAEPAVDGRRLRLLEEILSGEPQKVIAMDMDLAASTIALNARVGLRSVGIVSKPSRVHPLVMLAAKAARDRDLEVLGSMSVVFPHGVSLRAISVSRPDACMMGILPPAELSVIRSLVEGHSYQEIARRRGTSQRTIANQIAAVFHRIAVSSRNELVHRLFAQSAVRGTHCTSAVPPTDWSPLKMAAS